jgi:hypothetical protein
MDSSDMFLEHYPEHCRFLLYHHAPDWKKITTWKPVISSDVTGLFSLAFPAGRTGNTDFADTERADTELVEVSKCRSIRATEGTSPYRPSSLIPRFKSSAISETHEIVLYFIEKIFYILKKLPGYPSIHLCEE